MVNNADSEAQEKWCQLSIGLEGLLEIGLVGFHYTGAVNWQQQLHRPTFMNALAAQRTRSWYWRKVHSLHDPLSFVATTTSHPDALTASVKTTTLWVGRKQHTGLLPITSSNVNRFSKKIPLSDLVANVQQTHVLISHNAWSMSLYCLVNYECHKTSDNLKKMDWH